MDITETLEVADRAAWRQWLSENHASKKEIWLIYHTKTSGKARITYLDAVEEALCFGWIDGIAKKFDAERSAQRFTPRRPRSNWTELNKERARRLIAKGLMTDVGRAVLPDLSSGSFVFPQDILDAIRADPEAWQHFEAFSDLYKRVRVGFIEEQRKNPAEFQKRLAHFIAQTRKGRQYGTLE
jgi:uncharacterized protein YdeI (YjbR/CyaY-like superfamily)